MGLKLTTVLQKPTVDISKLELPTTALQQSTNVRSFLCMAPVFSINFIFKHIFVYADEIINTFFFGPYLSTKSKGSVCVNLKWIHALGVYLITKTNV